MIKTLETQISQFLLGCKCLVSRGFVMQEQDPLGDLPVAFFLQSVLQLHQQRWVILNHFENFCEKLSPPPNRNPIEHNLTSSYIQSPRYVHVLSHRNSLFTVFSPGPTCISL